MKISTRTKLDAVIEKDKGYKNYRYMTGIVVIGNILYATNGRILAAARTERNPNNDKGVFITPDSYNYAFLLAKKENKLTVDLAVGETITVHENEAAFPVPEYTKIPNIAGVIPKKEERTSIIINAKELLKLSKAIGSDEVRIEYIDENTPMRVYPLYGHDSFGLLMPIKDGLGFSKVDRLNEIEICEDFNEHYNAAEFVFDEEEGE